MGVTFTSPRKCLWNGPLVLNDPNPEDTIISNYDKDFISLTHAYGVK